MMIGFALVGLVAVLALGVGLVGGGIAAGGTCSITVTVSGNAGDVITNVVTATADGFASKASSSGEIFASRATIVSSAVMTSGFISTRDAS